MKNYEDPRYTSSGQPVNRSTSHTSYYSSSQNPVPQDMLGNQNIQTSYTFNKSPSGTYGTESVKRNIPSENLIQSPNANVLTSSYSIQKSTSGQLVTSPSGSGNVTTTVFVNKPPQQRAEIDYRKSVAEGFRSEK